MLRRQLMIGGAVAAVGAAGAAAYAAVRRPDEPAQEAALAEFDDAAAWMAITEAEWRERLTPAQFRVLRREGTEPAFTSPLEDEKRDGTYHCAGCDLTFFTSDMKYDSGSGWPSFFDALPGVFGTKTDFKLLYPRLEYHCARCGGHQGHIFDDGPPPHGLRYCNNGVALTFKPAEA